MSGSVIVEAALRLAGIAHAMDRPEWLDTAAAMLATVWDDPPRPASGRRCPIRPRCGGRWSMATRESTRTPIEAWSQPTLWGHASRVPGRGWRGGRSPPPSTPLRGRRLGHKL